MDMDSALRVEQLDWQISCLQATLSELSQTLMNPDRKTDFTLHGQKVKIENEIKQQRTVLRFMLEGQPRPWYLFRLPNEMLVEIFQWITDPFDKLRLLQIFPALGHLMHWDHNVLNFQMIYPLVQPYVCNEWQNVWNLCQVSREFMEVVLAHYKTCLEGITRTWNRPQQAVTYNKQFIREESDLLSLLRERDRLGRREWMANMPFLAVIGFESDTLEAFGSETPGYIERFLDTHGNNIWGCEIFLDLFDRSVDESHAILNGILTRTPNLLNLQVSTTPIRWWNAPPNNGPRNFSNLPQLQFLRTSNGPFAESLIRQYAPTLKHLWTSTSPPQDRVNWPLLQFYHCYYPGLIRNAFPNSLLAAPIKSVHLVLNSFRYVTHMPELLQYLSNFGNTLENLSIEYLPRMLWTDRGLLTPNREWMLRVHLPKLSFLELDKYLGKLDWMLALSSIQTLILRQHLLGEEEDRLTFPDFLHFPRSEATRFSTNAWVYLRNLSQIQVQVGWNPRNVFTVTRNEHEEYHKKQQSLQPVAPSFWRRMAPFLPFLPHDS